MTFAKIVKRTLVLVAFSGLVAQVAFSGVGKAAASIRASASHAVKTVEAPVFIDTRRLADVRPGLGVEVSNLDNDGRRFAD